VKNKIANVVEEGGSTAKSVVKFKSTEFAVLENIGFMNIPKFSLTLS